jgi:hypothetical protein
VKNSVGFNKVNTIVFEVLRRWVMETLENACNNEENELEKLCFQHGLGLLYLNLNNKFEIAESLLLDCLNRFEVMLGDTHEYTISTTNNLAVFYIY